MIPLEISINITGDHLVTCVGIIAGAFMFYVFFKD